MTVTREMVVSQARRWLGTPWVHQHRAIGVGVDCAGLVIGVARSLGLVPEDFDVQGYPRQPDGTLLDLCGLHMRTVSEPLPGRVLVVATHTDPQHIGILGDYAHGGLSIIHAADRSTLGCVVETRLVWARRFQLRGIYALPGVQDG